MELIDQDLRIPIYGDANSKAATRILPRSEMHVRISYLPAGT